ncbi:MAG TPA: NADH-quinone oxidoreductase subunit H [Armatimonadota bacterium]|jgi:formate hydrogenlyase subunit 4
MTPAMLLVVGAANLLLVPAFLAGVMRKVKALMQGRTGSPVLQPFFDLAKLWRKGETVSETATWVFTWAPRVFLAANVLVAILVPWSGVALMGGLPYAADYVYVLYLMGLGRFFSLLGALDTGSAFGGLGASREATLSVLVEPIVLLSLGALALQSGSTDLSTLFSGPVTPLVAVLSGFALLIAALGELSRMPVDDPTTHLELTMIHEAMILEYSGRGLAQIEAAVWVRACVFFGLASQALLRAWPGFENLGGLAQYGLGLAGLFLVGGLVAVAEGLLVKLNWRRVPHFLAFGIALGLLSALVAAARG